MCWRRSCQTPVIVQGQSSTPVSNVVMNSVTVITNSQDAVLRLTGAAKFLGAVIVTVSATNAENQVATQTFQVNVVKDATVSPPFLGPIPAGATVTQDMGTSFMLTSSNIDTNVTFFTVQDLATGVFPTNVSFSRERLPGRLWVYPDATLTGTVNLLFGVTAVNQSTDTQEFVLNVLPRSATPTMTIVPLKGSMVDSSKANGSHISVTGTFAFNSQSDQTFSSNDVMVLNLGDPSNPFSATLTPDLPGWKWRNGSVSAKAHLATSTSSKVNASAQFNIAKNTFAISISGFDFPSPGLTNNEIQVGVLIGVNYGGDVRPWVETEMTTNTSTYVPPAPVVTGSQ